MKYIPLLGTHYYIFHDNISLSSSLFFSVLLYQIKILICSLLTHSYCHNSVLHFIQFPDVALPLRKKLIIMAVKRYVWLFLMLMKWLYLILRKIERRYGSLMKFLTRHLLRKLYIKVKNLSCDLILYFVSYSLAHLFVISFCFYLYHRIPIYIFIYSLSLSSYLWLILLPPISIKLFLQMCLI